MSADVDFAALYRELGIDPREGMETFRRAYRRRVGELHPDRNDGDGFDLQRLNAAYASAIRFHRQYGRLPGTPAPPLAGEGAIHARSVAASEDIARINTPVRRGRTAYLLAVTVVLLAVLFSARQRETPMLPDDPAPPPDVRSMPTETISDQVWLDVGSPTSRVLDTQGVPIATDGNRWIYGPSWVRFDCLELVDWYSSPLHPLKTRSVRPAAQAQRMHRPAHPENCGKTALP